MDSTDEFSLSTGYEPKAYDFYETSVKPHIQLLESPPLFSDKVSSADPDYDDATLEDMLHQAHRAQAYHSLREDFSVSLSSSSMSDRGDPLEIDRCDPVSTETQKQRLGLCSTSKKSKFLQSAKQELINTNFKQFETKKFNNEINSFFKQFLQQNLELRQAHHRNLTEMEELRKFQSSTFYAIARRKLVEDQNTILEVSGRKQELQNEIICMTDSKDFQDAESIRSGNSHVSSRPVSFPPHPIPEGMLRHSFMVPSRREGPPSIWDTHGLSGKRFSNPDASPSAPYRQELNQWSSSREEPLHSSSGEK